MKNSGVHAMLMKRNEAAALVKSFRVALGNQIQLQCAKLAPFINQRMHQLSTSASASAFVFDRNSSRVPHAAAFVHQAACGNGTAVFIKHQMPAVMIKIIQLLFLRNMLFRHENLHPKTFAVRARLSRCKPFLCHF